MWIWGSKSHRCTKDPLWAPIGIVVSAVFSRLWQRQSAHHLSHRVSCLSNVCTPFLCMCALSRPKPTAEPHTYMLHVHTYVHAQVWLWAVEGLSGTETLKPCWVRFKKRSNSAADTPSAHFIIVCVCVCVAERFSFDISAWWLQRSQG